MSLILILCPLLCALAFLAGIGCGREMDNDEWIDAIERRWAEDEQRRACESERPVYRRHYIIGRQEWR